MFSALLQGPQDVCFSTTEVSVRSGDINMTLLLLMFHATHIRKAAVIYDQLQTLKVFEGYM